MRHLDEEVLSELKKVDEKLEVTKDIEVTKSLLALRQSLLNDGHYETEKEKQNGKNNK
jgi:hypothetical protein